MVDNREDNGEKKVDEGWKQKAREEKESLQEKGGAREPAPEGRETGETAEEERPSAAGEAMLPVTFVGFVSGLATQVFISLGMVENPLSGKKEKNLDTARHVLDTLAMLQEKTSGNLKEQESAYLEDLLYNLRMAFVRENR